MADRYYGVALGGELPVDVTEAGTTTSAAIELRVTYDASGASRQLVLNAVEAIRNYLIQDTWPPA